MDSVERRIRVWLGSLASSGCTKCYHQQLLNVTLKKAPSSAKKFLHETAPYFTLGETQWLGHTYLVHSVMDWTLNILVFLCSCLWKLLFFVSGMKKDLYTWKLRWFLASTLPFYSKICVHSQVWIRLSSLSRCSELVWRDLGPSWTTPTAGLWGANLAWGVDGRWTSEGQNLFSWIWKKVPACSLTSLTKLVGLCWKWMREETQLLLCQCSCRYGNKQLGE